jgi:hypothetical protein
MTIIAERHCVGFMGICRNNRVYQLLLQFVADFLPSLPGEPAKIREKGRVFAPTHFQHEFLFGGTLLPD